jgi:hypothetical protein
MAGFNVITEGAIDEAIRVLKIKDLEAYSGYNWRTKLHERKAKESGTIPKGTVSIYNENAVRFLTESLRK